MDLEAFKAKFNFDPALSLHLGIEREAFIVNGTGKIAPKAEHLLKVMHGPYPMTEFGRPIDEEQRFSYELSACQIEGRTKPRTLQRLSAELRRCDEILALGMQHIDCRVLHQEVGPADMPLDVFNDPTGRYQAITAGMERDTLLAACRLTGTHVHVGMPDHETAMRVHNRVIKHTRRLCALGDRSRGERIRIYEAMNPDCMPEPFADWNDFHRFAEERMYTEDPRRCWRWVRISVRGTIEFRMFGTTDSSEEVFGWACECHRLCEEAMV
ncbi:MAG: hypothetical protein JO019_00100 [Candidatus Kaiserbacteria bacterium]|nr:hypothetical protein [Candidatus Kaiserbacteria bacterium]